MKSKPGVYVFVLLCLLYAAITLLSPIDPAVLSKYAITESHARLLTLSVVVPLITIWSTAIYGSTRFKDYSDFIEDTNEGLPFKFISRGLIVFAYSLPINAIISSVLSYFAVKNPDFLSTSTIIRNYSGLILPAVGISLIGKGANGLIASLKQKRIQTWPPMALPGIIILSSIYTWLVTTRPFSGTADTSYFLPNWLILSTLVIPYVYIWCQGILSAYKLFVYKDHIKGAVYKKSLDYLAKGVTAIIVLSILSQFLISISVRINRLNLTPILALIYIIIALNALGYGLVARSAKKLKLIEEV